MSEESPGGPLRPGELATVLAATLVVGCGGSGQSATSPLDCPARTVEGDQIVESAAQLEGLRGATRITGSLTLTGLPATSLDPLACLASVDELVVRDNPGLEELALAELVDIVGGGLTVTGNPALGALELPALESVAQRVEIRDNLALLSLRGLDALDDAAGFSLEGCPQVQDLTGLGSLSDIDLLTLTNNAGLTSLVGLESVTFLGSVAIVNNGALVSLAGFPTAKVRSLSVGNNPVLTSVDGLEGLTSIDVLQFTDHPLLSDLSALGNLTQMPGAYLSGEGLDRAHLLIRGNDSLNSLAGLQGLTLVEGFVEIENNPGLQDLSALRSLGRVAAGLTLLNNDGLISVDHLNPQLQGSLTDVGEWISIGLNAQLPTCSAQGLADALQGLGFTGQTEIWENLPDACG